MKTQDKTSLFYWRLVATIPLLTCVNIHGDRRNVQSWVSHMHRLGLYGTA